MIRAIVSGILVAVSASAGPAEAPPPRPDVVGRISRPALDGIGPARAYPATIIRVIDGDTSVLAINLGFGLTLAEPVRIEGIDTPEVRGSEKAVGLRVTAFVRSWLDAADRIVVVVRSECERDKFGRVLGRIYADGVDLSPILLETDRAVAMSYPC